MLRCCSDVYLVFEVMFLHCECPDDPKYTLNTF